MNKKQRNKNRDTAKKLELSLAPKNKCYCCGEITNDKHFVPPSFGEKGFWLCDYTILPESDQRKGL